MLKFVLLVISLSCAYCAPEKAPRVTLNDGLKMPAVGLGLFGTHDKSYQAVLDAFDSGYRAFDTAPDYDSEQHLGRALKELISSGKVKREELFITTKIDNAGKAAVAKDLNVSLTKLGLTYVDLYLMHYPKGDFVDTWMGMEDIHKQGLAKSIGVSNFNEQQLDQLLAKATVKPVTNQVRTAVYGNQKNMNDYAKKHNLTLTAWAPLGGGTKYGPSNGMLSNAKLVDIGKAHNKSSAQIALKFLVQRGIFVIPESLSKAHIADNINLFDFTLTDAEMKDIEALNR